MNLLKQYKASLKSVEVEELIELFFYRPLAFFFIKLIYPTSITPNQVTLSGAFVGVVGSVLLATGKAQYMLWAAVLFLIFNVLDCSDGQLARLKNSGSPLGRIIDGMADYVVSISAYLGLGIGLAAQAENPLLFWVLLIVTAASNVFHAVSVDYFRNRFLDNTQPERKARQNLVNELNATFKQINEIKGHNMRNFVLAVYTRYTAMQHKMVTKKKDTIDISPEKYYAANKVVIHFWTYLGPATQWTFLTVCVLLNKPYIYFFGMIVVLNSYAVLLHLIQKSIDRKLLRKM